MTNDGSKRIIYVLLYYQPFAFYRLPVLHEKSRSNSLYIWCLKTHSICWCFVSFYCESSSKPWIIQTEKTKENKYLMSVWKTDEKRPTSASFISLYQFIFWRSNIKHISSYRRPQRTQVKDTPLRRIFQLSTQLWII